MPDEITDWGDEITVLHGRMRLTFPAGTPRAEIDKRLKAIDRATKESPTPKRPSLPKLTRVKVPSKDMLEAAGRKGVTMQRPDMPEVILPEDRLHAGLVATAERELKLWAKHDPHGYRQFMAKVESGAIDNVPTEYIERMLASILRPGGRVSGKFAGSVVYGLAELAKRKSNPVEGVA